MSQSVPHDPQSLELWQTMLRTFFRLRHAIRPIFAQHGLTGPQWRVFRLLGEAGPQGLTPGEVSERLCVTPGNTTGITDKLEEAGLVERQPHPDDRRALLLRLTPPGKALYAQLKPIFEQRVTEVFACLSPEQKAQLLTSLQQLLEHVNSLLPPEAAEGGGNGQGS